MLESAAAILHKPSEGNTFPLAGPQAEGGIATRQGAPRPPLYWPRTTGLPKRPPIGARYAREAVIAVHTPYRFVPAEGDVGQNLR